MRIILRTKTNKAGNYKTLIINYDKKTFKKDYNTRGGSINDLFIKADSKTINDAMTQLRFNDFKEEA